MRVLIVVTHLLGVGHLTRAATIGRALARAGHVVRLVSGGRPAPTVDMTGIELVQLPTVHVRGAAFNVLYRPDDARADSDYMAGRQVDLIKSARDFGPDAVVIELFPFGRRQLREEMLALIAELRRPPSSTVLLTSIRDVLAPPSSEAKRQQTARWLGLFDRILVHSDPAVMPLEASWPVDAALAKRLVYTGYVSDAQAIAPRERGSILVSGGGSSASLPLALTALDAAKGDGRDWRVLVGHGMPEQDFSMLRISAPPNAIVERARRDFPVLLASAACSVSQFGYNTALDLAASATPAVVVPYDEANETEQGLRARRFASMGLVEHLPARDLSPGSLLAAITNAMARGVAPVSLDTGGAGRTVDVIAQAVAAKREDAEGWQALAAALDRAGNDGRDARFWWRDDDAVAPTDALDDLLRLRAQLCLPLALAVIPRMATQALADRLADEPDIDVLVHGIGHDNRAPADQKKQELIAADPSTLAGLREGRERLGELFGARAIPVLVPPWNRIAPDVLGQLGGLGFSGWSGFAGNHPAAGPSNGLSSLPTHIDIIDWRRGEVAAARPLLRRLAGLIDAQRPDDPPIGILSHHLQHDAWISAFLEALLCVLASHSAARFFSARTALGLTGRAQEGGQAG